MNLLYRHGPAGAAFIALAAALMTVSACGTTAASRTDGPAGCPARAPALTTPATPATTTRAPVLPGGAVTATICQYAPGLTGSKMAVTPQRRLVLRGLAAEGLRAVLSGAGRMTQLAARCAGAAALLPIEQVIYLSYRAGQTSYVTVRFTSCELAIVAAASNFGLLASPLQDDLFGYSLITRHDRGPVVPDLIGLDAARAATVARRQNFTLTVDGQVVDPTVPAGTVIFQVLPPGVPDPGPSPYSVGTILAVRTAPGCRASQLRLSYRAGGASAGSDFGVILFRDVAPAPCQLDGRLQVTGVGPDGRAVTNSVTATIAGPGVLTPSMQPVRDLAPVPPGIVALMLHAEYRDDPTSANGLCAARYVIAARWRVSLPDGSVVMVPNADSGGPHRPSSAGGLVTCRGRLDADGQATVDS